MNMKAAKLVERVTLTVLAVAVVCGAAWLGGFDYDSRGLPAAVLFVDSIIIGFLAWWFSGRK